MSGKISESEFTVLRALWEAGESSAQDLHRHLQTSNNWKLNTVKTLIGRLVDKQVVGFKKLGKKYLYHPLVTREEYLQNYSSQVIKQFFGGSLSDFVAGFISNESLSESELRSLKEMIADMEKQ